MTKALCTIRLSIPMRLWMGALLVILLTAVSPRVAAATPITRVEILNIDGGFQQTSGVPTSTLTSGSDSGSASFGPLGAGAFGLASFVTVSWFDHFTITGGSGTGTMTVSWSLDGTLVNSSTASCSTCTGPSAGYISLFTGGPSTGLAGVRQDDPGSQNVALAGTFDVLFTYGTPFNAGFRLSAGAGDGNRAGQYADFLNTGDITSLILPDGATLTTASGATYPIAATAVPEPTSLALLALGSGLLAAARRRQRLP